MMQERSGGLERRCGGLEVPVAPEAFDAPEEEPRRVGQDLEGARVLEDDDVEHAVVEARPRRDHGPAAVLAAVHEAHDQGAAFEALLAGREPPRRRRITKGTGQAQAYI